MSKPKPPPPIRPGPAPVETEERTAETKKARAEIARVEQQLKAADAARQRAADDAPSSP